VDALLCFQVEFRLNTAGKFSMRVRPIEDTSLYKRELAESSLEMENVKLDLST
jgi:hypothetical protein